MLKQNYIRVYENEGGSVSIVSGHDDDETQRLSLDILTIEYCDLRLVANELIKIAEEKESE